MIPTAHLKNKTEPDQVPVTFVSLSIDPLRLTKHTQVGSLQVYANYHKIQSTAEVVNKPGCY